MGEQLDIVDLVSTLLDAGKIKEALAVPKEKKLENIFKDNCWDLIAVVIEKIQDDTIVLKPSLYGACEELLTIILEKCSAEEALLEFIERVELAKNDAQFGLVLPLLRKLLMKLSSKRGRSLEWSLNSISTYIENIPVTEHKLEGDERMLMDSDPNMRRIIRVYALLPTFYGPFIEELLGMEKKNLQAKQTIVAFLINLLGKPLIYIDMDPSLNKSSEARLVCQQIVQDIFKLENNLLKFLSHVQICSKETQRTKVSNDRELEPYEHREKINMTTLSGLFYVVYSGHFDIPDTAVPQVYSTEYVVQTVMLTVIHFLNITEYGPLMKGLATCKALTDHLADNTSHALLSASVHCNLIKRLMNVAIYSNYPSIRLAALNSIGSYIQKFEYKALRAARRINLPLAAVVPINSTQRTFRHYCQGNIEKETKVPAVSIENEEHQYEENVKNQILEKALEFVPKSGWSVESLSAGAKAAGYPTITHGLFPNGGGDLVHYFNVKCNEGLVAQMKTWPKEESKESKVPVKFIENAIMSRLLMLEPYKSTWPKAMAIQTLPNNVPNCLATLLSLVDDICYHSGDRSVDFNWYVRRVGLAGIYKTSELFYITDSTQGNSGTRSFVSSRIRDAQLIQAALNLNPVAAAPSTLSAAFVTAKNILGVNTLK